MSDRFTLWNCQLFQRGLPRGISFVQQGLPRGMKKNPWDKNPFPGYALYYVFLCFLDCWRCSFSHILNFLWLNPSDIRDSFIQRFCIFEGTNDSAKAGFSLTAYQR